MNFIEELSELRQEIDDIDNEIVNLLIKRLNIVQKVGKLKQQHKHSSAKSFIKRGREADMMRHLISQLSEHYPKEAIFKIWRSIIASSLHVEQGLKIEILENPADFYKSAYWLGREYFGSFSPVNINHSFENVIDNLASKIGSVGILPFPDANN